jgi:hypothetical protein
VLPQRPRCDRDEPDLAWEHSRGGRQCLVRAGPLRSARPRRLSTARARRSCSSRGRSGPRRLRRGRDPGERRASARPCWTLLVSMRASGRATSQRPSARGDRQTELALTHRP